MTTYALRLENSTDTAARMRIGDLLTLPPGASPLTAKSGLRPDGGGVVTVSAGTMNINVSAFAAWVQGGVSVVQGGYTFVNDASVALAVGAGHASLSRTDTVAAVVRDNAYDSSGQVLASVIVVAGTPGAGAPALPTNATPLRDIVVQAGLSAGNGGLQTSNLSTDRRVFLGVAPEDSGWIAPTFAANWTNNAFGYTQPRYKKLGKEVLLEGTILRASSASGSNSTMFTLPVGFRPIAQEICSADSGGGYVQLNILPSGAVYTFQSIAAGSAVSYVARFSVD